MPASPVTAQTTPKRHRERVSYDRDAAYAILDEATVCHLARSTGGGAPTCLPTLHARVGDTLYLHGSTGSGAALDARRPDPVCVTVTLHDGWVLARSQFNHSANYRCVVVYGPPRLVSDEGEKRAAMTALVDKVAPGRAADSRAPDGKELAATAVLAIPLTELSVKARGHGVVDEPEDLDLPYWAGLVPLRTVAGRPEPDPRGRAPLPGYLRPSRSPWLTPVVLRGRHVILEPLDLSHVDGLLAAIGDPEVFRHIPWPQPTDPAGMAALVTSFLADAIAGQRVPFTQRDAETGEIAGTTSYMTPDPDRRSVEIGSTMIGRRWWRTGINTEAKLLLLRHAFEELGAVRVEWQTDIRNERSQAAIARLGATREGVLRRNRKRGDGSFRDSVVYSMIPDDWPAARERLSGMLERPETDR